jgi:hypothetical protein
VTILVHRAGAWFFFFFFPGSRGKGEGTKVYCGYDLVQSL